MARYIPEAVEAYAERYTSARADVFDRLAAETEATQKDHGMMVGLIEGAFLSFLVSMAHAENVVEVGTFTGWSAIAMARALPPDGRLVSCDVNEDTTAIARRYAEEAGVADRIDFRIGPALDTLRTLEGPLRPRFRRRRQGRLRRLLRSASPEALAERSHRRRQHPLRHRPRG